jgi:GMP synthase-like glutamine amidotransferase
MDKINLFTESMDKKVLVFVHSIYEQPGYVTDILVKYSIPHQFVYSYKEPIPALDDSIAGLIFLGGTMSANSGIAWIEQEIQLIKEALYYGLPVMGHCLGGQLITRALDQKVYKNAFKEVGWHPCKREDNQTANEWLGDIEDPFNMFHWHNETFDIPPDAVPLFSSQFCKNQAYLYRENVLAMQCHIEMTEDLINLWLEVEADEILKETISEQTDPIMRENLPEKVKGLNKVAEQLYKQWLITVKL